MTVQGGRDGVPRYDEAAREYDAVLVMSFGGPEGPDDVIPFLENVTRGRNVPRARLEEVAHHYDLFDGVSPINAQNRALITALQAELETHGIQLPVYFGNRNWAPFVEDTMTHMKDDGVRRALVFFTSAFSSYSGCRQYREDIIRAQAAVGDGAPVCDRIRMFFNHPGFIEPIADGVGAALPRLGAPAGKTRVAFTAHSIPMAMAECCDYEVQLRETARLVAERAGVSGYDVVYQSRSGPPQVPWLEPDVLDYMDGIAASGVTHLVIAPIGFVSDHLEVLFDLDTEAADKARKLGIKMVRAPTVGTDPRFVSMIRELIVERMTDKPARTALGDYPAGHDVCPVDCCLERRVG